MAKQELLAKFRDRFWAQELPKAPAGTDVDEVFLLTDVPAAGPAGHHGVIRATGCDVTGGVPLKIFPEDVQNCVLKLGSTVRVRGELRRGVGGSWWVVARRMELKQIEDVRMVTPVVYRPIEDLETELETFSGRVTSAPYWRILALFMDDEEWRDDLRLAAMTDFFPLSYVGGLVERTVNLTGIVIARCKDDPNLKQDLLVCAAILHGIGKIDVFERRGDGVVRSKKGRAHHEVFIARDMIRERVERHDRDLEGAESIDFDSTEVRAVVHCITATFGKCFLPQGKFGIPEAEVLHDVAAL